MAILLEEYGKYLENLASTKSSDIFTNGGKEHASILMSKMFKYTSNEVRMFCEGFKPELIMTNPYNTALIEYLHLGKSLKILLETNEYTEKDAFKIIREENSRRRKENSPIIECKLIADEYKKMIFDKLSSVHCNFSIFDNDKFRLEISPEDYKAIGSFNSPERASLLIKLFDQAFENAETIN